MGGTEPSHVMLCLPTAKACILGLHSATMVTTRRRLCTAAAAAVPRRSALYMPGSNLRALEKARSLDADVLILDCEDAVAPENKEAARRNIAEAVRSGGYGHRELVVRLADPSSEAAYEHEAASLAPFRLTLAGAWAAMPNLLAEMLHPTSHWSLHVDNEVAPAAAHASPAAPEQAKIRRSGASAVGASELQAAPLFARTDSASSL